MAPVLRSRANEEIRAEHVIFFAATPGRPVMSTSNLAAHAGKRLAGNVGE